MQAKPKPQIAILAIKTPGKTWSIQVELSLQQSADPSGNVAKQGVQPRIHYRTALSMSAAVPSHPDTSA
jgi:hypothetical protein